MLHSGVMVASTFCTELQAAFFWKIADRREGGLIPSVKASPILEEYTCSGNATIVFILEGTWPCLSKACLLTNPRSQEHFIKKVTDVFNKLQNFMDDFSSDQLCKRAEVKPPSKTHMSKSFHIAGCRTLMFRPVKLR
jgi:hypothetical protein